MWLAKTNNVRGENQKVGKPTLKETLDRKATVEVIRLTGKKKWIKIKEKEPKKRVSIKRMKIY
jgi:hypothetical protein